jgi:hypothetical protein
MRRLAILGLSAVLGTACVGTPQPDPPNVVMDPDQVYSDLPNYGGLELHGRAGSVDPPGSIVRIHDLESDDPPVDATVAADGSFDAEVPGSIGDEVRLQAIFEDARSAPLDLLVDFDGAGPAPRPLADCLTTTPGLELDVPAGPAATLEIRNDCTGAATLASVSLRYDPSPFSIVDAPADVPEGEAATVTLEYDPGLGIEEEILMIEVSGPEADRRPVTLWGVGP